MNDSQPSTERSAAEWIGLAVSGVIVVALVALVVWTAPSPGDPPTRIEIKPDWSESVAEEGSRLVPIDIINTGQVAAMNLHVELILAAEQQTTTVRVELDQLAPGEQARAWLRVPDGARPDQLVATLVYLEP